MIGRTDVPKKRHPANQMPQPPDNPHPAPPKPLNWTVLLAAGVCLMLIFLPEARNLGEWAAGLIVATALIVFITMHLAPKDVSRMERPALMARSCLILLFAGAFLTALFWSRAWMAMPSVWGARPVMIWTQIIGFWWPGVLFAALCRHVPERFKPASRVRFTAQLWWGLAGSVIGMFIHIVMLGFREAWS